MTEYEAWIEGADGRTRITHLDAEGIREAHALAVVQCDEDRGEFVRGVQPVDETAAR